MWEAARQEEVDIGAEIAGKANDSRVAGVVVTPTGAQTFQGNVFVVLNEPRWNGSEVQSESFDVFVVHNLSGFSNVVGTAKFVSFEVGELGTEDCCGTQPNVCEGNDWTFPVGLSNCPPNASGADCIGYDESDRISNAFLGPYRAATTQDATSRFASLRGPNGAPVNGRAPTGFGIFGIDEVSWSSAPRAIFSGSTCKIYH